METVYFDELHKRGADGKRVFLKTVLVLGCVVLCPAVFVVAGQLGLLLAAGVVYGAYLLFQRLNQEFEYIYTNGELDIDVIYGKRSRRRVLSVKPRQIELVCRAKPHLDQYQKQFSAKQVTDCSDGDLQHAYLMITGSTNAKKLILFSPSERLLTAWKPYLRDRLREE